MASHTHSCALPPKTCIRGGQTRKSGFGPAPGSTSQGMVPGIARHARQVPYAVSRFRDIDSFRRPGVSRNALSAAYNSAAQVGVGHRASGATSDGLRNSFGTIWVPIYTETLYIIYIYIYICIYIYGFFFGGYLWYKTGKPRENPPIWGGGHPTRDTSRALGTPGNHANNGCVF